MGIFNKKEPFLLFIGDFIIFSFSLWISLIIRNVGFSSLDAYADIFVPFIVVFLAWSLVFFIAGLYDKYTTLLKDKLPAMIFNSQLANSFIALAFFYFIPYFGITPKTILFIDLFVSFIFIYTWRIYSPKIFGLKRKEPSLIIGSGEEVKELLEEVNHNAQSELNFVSHIDLDVTSGTVNIQAILDIVKAEHISVIVADLKDKRIEPILPSLYNLIFTGIKFVDLDAIYEDTFSRIPVSLLKYDWFFENISVAQKTTYDLLKRGMDIAISLVLGIISLIFYPFVIFAIKLDDGGSIFITQQRVGKGGALVKIIKFRSMSGNDSGKYGADGKTTLVVTRIGGFLRKSRIDELPQLWNVFLGDMSLTGPRPELPTLVELYEKEIAYYGIRHLIKPGLTGWAQIYHDNHPHHGSAVFETKEKLSYDLYYVKNRSIMLDIQIALKTVKKVLSIGGL